MFSPAFAGGATPPRTPPLLTWFFVVLGQVVGQLCQENPRTCRGQSRESKNLPRTKPRRKSVRTPPRKLKSFKALFFQTPFLIATAQTPKTLGGGTPPQGGFNPPPYGDGVLNNSIQVFEFPSGSSFRILLLRGSCLPPPKSSPTGPGPTPSSAAICGAGAPWRLLDRTNRCLLYTSPSPRDLSTSRMPSSA